MASQKHHGLLSSGKTLWNTWRQAYAVVQAKEPDLHEADLQGVDLHGVDLTEANLQGAHLREADFSKADLLAAALEGAIVSKTLFDEARMSRRDPRGTDPDTFDRHEFGSTGVKI